MSINSIAPFITKNYGLKDEDLDVILPRENLKDVSAKFSAALLNTQERFKTNIRIRVLEFDRNSGSDIEGRMNFNALADAERTVFYYHTFSNRDCCVFFIYAGYKIESERMFNNRVIPHEFTHHYQLVNGFPCLLPNGCPTQYFPAFSNTKMIGPKSGDVFVDGLLIKNCLISFLKDFSERIADLVCESILIEKGITEGFLDTYRKLVKEDLTKVLPKSIPGYSQVVRYMYRLGLRDEAEWHALLRRIHPDDSQLKIEMKMNSKKIFKLNKELAQRKEAFRKILEITEKTKYTDFKDVRNALNYIKQVSKLLNIEIKSKEKW